MEDHLNMFGEVLMKDVRDASIHEMDKIIDGKMTGEIAERIQCILKEKENTVEIIKAITPYIIDRTLDNLLFCIEENTDIEVLYKKENVAVLSDGLSGELYSDDGWIEKYSKERKR